MKTTVTIQKNDAGQRLDKFLTKTYPNLPQSLLYKALRKKDIRLNGKRCDKADRLQEGDVLALSGSIPSMTCTRQNQTC